ncbi:N-acetyl sugar amidotransferase [Prochlorococcus marinus]|uniref:Legionaminic acid biosynthesis protein PtmG n=1 Tax=Prochlorococcus marinus (strain MIT 9303) TaxID=59922 RepID=A2CB96_PROM3|nr:N-acetyl sugar amidotransferase [Prochlorococcus marinus]ABM78756.1 Hypothetical protein P9303_20141 [Prochlorococcus marinus str. MIT 9303]
MQGIDNTVEVVSCSNCLAMSTRPRISFDERGWCNACTWMERKKHLDWDLRQKELRKLLLEYKEGSGKFDCLVPVSGGKDGSYVSYNLKHKYGMNPLCITITPPLPLKLGEENLKSFINCGYNHISMNPSSIAMKEINKLGFKEMGFPYFGWLIAILTIPIRIAMDLGIKLIFYGEDGEVEYGGSTETISNPFINVDYIREVYLEDGYDRVLNKINLPESDLNLFRFPEGNKSQLDDIKIVHWSYFENWDPYRNYMVAKEYCGLKEAPKTNIGTFTNFAQNDQALYALHTYLMYLKFGFGRANQDACIEIRRGAMDRDQALTLVDLYDGQYPDHFTEMYLEYFEVNQEEFDQILDQWANKKLFNKIKGRWRPKFKLL